MHHVVRRTEYKDGKPVDPPPGKMHVYERELKAGDKFKTTGGDFYEVGENGALRRLDKHKGVSKKERRMRRATIKAVRAARQRNLDVVSHEAVVDGKAISVSDEDKT